MNNRILEFLNELDLNQKSFAKQIGMTESEFSKIVNNKKPGLWLETAKRIAKALGKKVDDVWPD